MPIIGAKYYSKVEEWEYTFSEKKLMCLSISPMKIEFRANMMKFRIRLECTCSTFRKSSGHQVAKSSHILSKSMEVSKYYLVFLRVKLL
jgi:hypothetical protein